DEPSGGGEEPDSWTAAEPGHGGAGRQTAVEREGDQLARGADGGRAPGVAAGHGGGRAGGPERTDSASGKAAQPDRAGEPGGGAAADDPRGGRAHGRGG